MSRAVLGRVTLALGAVGVCLAAIPFIGSLAPSASIEAKLPRIRVADLKPGEVVFLDAKPYGRRVLVLKQYDQSLRVFGVPVKEGRVGMPDFHWWHPMYWCKDFGPEMTDGRFLPNSLITCHDSPLPDGAWQTYWRWDLNGKSLSQFEDIPQATYVSEAGDIVVGKRE